MSDFILCVLRSIQNTNHNHLCMSWQTATIFVSVDYLSLPWFPLSAFPALPAFLLRVWGFAFPRFILVIGGLFGFSVCRLGVFLCLSEPESRCIQIKQHENSEQLCDPQNDENARSFDTLDTGNSLRSINEFPSWQQNLTCPISNHSLHRKIFT